MKKTALAIAITGMLFAPLASHAETAAPAAAAPAAATPPAPPPFTGNVTLASEYLYRGIAQTHGKPALQGGFDYAHPSGFYVGTWGSTISWLADVGGGISAPLELDIYGGYKNSISDDWSYDVGVLTYNYPGTYPGGFTKPDTTELYGQLGFKWLTAKYSYVVSDHIFGITSTKGGKTNGSGYLDLTATFDLGNGWGISGHGGHQTIKDNGPASYSDWKIGVTKDLGLGTVGLYYSDTNAKGGPNQFYRDALNHDMGQGRALLSFTKTL